MEIDLQTANATVLFLVSIGLSLLSYFLFRPDKPEVIRDDKPTTAMLRGNYVPLVIGQRKVGAIVGWVGDRITTTESENVGGS